MTLIDSRRRYIYLVLLVATLILAAPTGATAANAIDVVMLRAGKGIVAVVTRVCTLLTQMGGQNFSAVVASTAFSEANRKVRISITGTFRAPGRHVRGRLLAGINQDCPLPYRAECQGILRIALPANAAAAEPNTFYPVSYRLDLAVDVDQTLKVLTMMGLGFGLKNVDMFPDEAFLDLVGKIPSENLRTVLTTFFPGFVGYLEKRTISRGVDEILADGRLTGTKVLQGIGLDELIGFAVNFGLGMAQMTATTFVKDAVALGAGAAAVAMPGLGAVAVGVLLEVVAVKATGILIDQTKDQFERGIYRDRFAKIDAYLQGTWEPGQAHIPWLIETITTEAKSEDYKTIEKLIIYLRNKEPLERNWWTSVYPRVRQPLVFQSQQDGSWLAARYVSMLDLLFKQ